MAENFNEFINSERARLRSEREAVLKQQSDLQSKLGEIDREMAAIEAYEAAKAGKGSSGHQSRGGGARAARRGSKRDDLLRVISAGQGLSRGEILDRMGLKGDKSGEMSVSNALTALTKTGQVSRENGKYRLAA